MTDGIIQESTELVDGLVSSAHASIIRFEGMSVFNTEGTRTRKSFHITLMALRRAFQNRRSAKKTVTKIKANATKLTVAQMQRAACEKFIRSSHGTRKITDARRSKLGPFEFAI